MEKNEKKSALNKSIITLLVIIIIALLAIGLIAWSRYRTTVSGAASANTAQWSFKVEDGIADTEEIDFPLTRTDTNESVAAGKIAPGTYGELTIGLDASGTETALTYSIEANLENKPTNLKFYSDAERTIELIVINGKFTKSDYMTLEQVKNNGARTETIYWEWPEQTGTTTEEIEANDEVDTNYSSKTINMAVTVTGKQLTGDPTLADLVQVGDYVNYDAGSGTISATGYDGAALNGSLSASQISSWRVLSKNQATGEVELIAANPTSTKMTLSGINGYKNAIDALNTTCAIFKNETYAQEARSINVDDIMQYSNFNPQTYYTNNHSSTGTVGGTKQYTSGTFITGEQYKDENGEIKDVVTGGTDNGDGTVTASETSPVTIIQTSWHSINELTTKQSFTSEIFNMFFKTLAGNSKPTYILASRCTTLGPTAATFRVRIVYKDTSVIDGTNMYKSDSGDLEGYPLSMCPVVRLKSNIKTTGQEDGVWQLQAN